MSRFLALIVVAATALFISASGGPAMAQETGGINVQGDFVSQQLDVNVQDSEVVTKFFELDDSVSSTWTISGEGVMNVAERLQNGDGNIGFIQQNAPANNFNYNSNQMNVALQYQLGSLNTDTITQAPTSNLTNNFVKDIQIGVGNIGTTLQN